ncbi:MAG TPA: PAS domain-containing sensor histidine kinase [Mycobacteriales bacterium]|nr:PAS domain-containing sensor histidine kinase [Mycobacteriales bacterium]
MAELVVPPAKAAVKVPPQRAAEPDGSSADVLRRLGLEALVEVMERSAYGVCITGDDYTWVYLNPAAEAMLGQSFQELQGQCYLHCFPEHERRALMGLEQDQRHGDTGFYTNTIVRPDGTQVEMTWSGVVIEVDGREFAPAFFHATADLRRAEREAAGLGAAAAQVAGSNGVGEVLTALASQAVHGTRAAGCLVLLTESWNGDVRVAAADSVPAGAAAALQEAPLRLTDLPGADLLLAGRLVPMTDDRSRLLDRGATAGLLAATSGLDWEGSVKVPLSRAGEVVGCLLVLLPRTLTAPSESELAYLAALGSHASVALEHARLREQVALSAVELERRRLGRDLHDSVSQALFALHARAQVVTRALAVNDRDVLQQAAADMEGIAQQAIAEMRAMLADLRSETPPAGLLAGLEELARRLTDREGLPTQLHVVGALPQVPAETAQHLHRIAGEALHNCVKHAGASGATVTLTTSSGELVLTVADDGRGFDPAAVGGAGHGRRTMHERASLCGGSVHVDGAPGRGTQVVVRVPLHR